MRNRRLTRGAASVVVIGVDNHGMGLIRECLGTEAVLPTHATPYEDALAVVRKTRPTVVVMGFDEDFEEAVQLGGVLAEEASGLHMVAISERTDPERIRAAMRAGYREYVVLPEDSELLRRAVHESSQGDRPDQDQGMVVALVGSKGGCGTSFLTVNLAAEMSVIERVVTIDFDFSMGDIAAYLDLQPNKSIHDLMRQIDRIDERMLAGSVVVHPSKVHVLPQPTELVDFDELRGEDIMVVLSAAADAYQYVMVACGTRIDEATLTATSVADVVLLVTTPDVVAVRNAWRRLQLLDRLGIDRSTVRLVVNKSGRSNELRDADIETNLGVPIAAAIADDLPSCQRAVNKGQLLREVAGRSPTYRDLVAAVELITDGAEKVEPAQTTSSFWRIFR